MASKFGLAGGIPERRVRPIWDAIDSRQFKNALKLSTSLLAKFPNSPYAIVLKALVLERMGKNDEAFSVCMNARDVLFNNPNASVDELTLSTMQTVFQRLDHLDMATSCYEHACTKYSNNMELMMGLFNCYVHEYSFVKQQQTAIKLYKVANEEKFLLWAVCSIQLQVCCGNGGEKLLLLAEGLLKKHIASHGLHELEALNIYISLLEHQFKYNDALEILSGKLGTLMTIEVDRLYLKGKLLAKAGDFAAAADVFQKVLEQRPDDWECYLHYFDCLIEDETVFIKDSDPMHMQNPTACKKLQISEELFDSRMSDAVNFIIKLMEANDNSLRCTHLALIEIEKQKLLFRKGDSAKVVAGLVLYFSRFGHLACFSSDIEMFLQHLDGNRKSEFLNKVVEEQENIVADQAKALGRSISVFKIMSLVDVAEDSYIPNLENAAVNMMETFCRNLPLSRDLDLQETMHGEELLSLACNVLVQLFWRTRHFGYLLESMLILEFGLAIRRHVWQYKLLLVHLYSYWSALPLAYERYKSLDVKNILLETVSHHILPQMLASPFWSDLNNLLSDNLKFMNDHFQESADLTYLAYCHRSYSKVIEFVQFKEGLQRSSQYLVAKIESAILQLKQNSSNVDEQEHVLEKLNYGTHFVEISSEIRCKSLTFNEDLNLRPWWTPTFNRNYLMGPFERVSSLRENRASEIKHSHDRVLKNIEIRSLFPRMIYLSMHSASASVKENMEVNGSSTDLKLAEELKPLLVRFAKIMDLPFHDAVEHAIEISNGEKLFEGLCSDIVDWMNFAVFLNAWNLSCHEIKGTDGFSTWKLVSSLFKKVVIETMKQAGPLVSSIGVDLSILVRLVSEPMAWHILIIQSCIRSLPPSGRKKKKGSVEQSSSFSSKEMQESILCLCDSMDFIMKWLNEQLNKQSDEKLEAMLSLVRINDGSNGPGKVLKTLQSSISVMNSSDLGTRIFDAVHSWNPGNVTRKIVSGQDKYLSELLGICKSKSKLLQSLQVQLFSVS